MVLEEFDENPFLPSFYADPERYAFSVELSFLAQRYHQLKRVSEQDLFRPQTIADYSIGKSLVFAQATLPKDELKLFRDLYDIMYTDLVVPELIIYLHLPLDRIRAQIAKRGRSYEKDISVDYLDKLHGLYMDHLQKLSGARVLIVDMGDLDLLADTSGYERFKSLLEVGHNPGVEIVRISEL